MSACVEVNILEYSKKNWVLALTRFPGILRVTVNGSHKANNSYVDPTLSICPPDTKKWVLDLDPLPVGRCLVLLATLWCK